MTTDRAKAERYARAILEAVVEQWQSILNAVAEALVQHPEAAAVVQDPGKDLDTRFAALEPFLPEGTPQEVRNFLRLLIQSNDVELLPLVSAALRAALAGEEKPLTAEITSAVELTDAQKEEIMARLRAQYGEGISFVFRVDPSLLGGLRIRVGDKLIDNSVASRLTALREVIAAAAR